jgi:hypothetical protein
MLVGRMSADLLARAKSRLLTPELPLASIEDMNIPQCVDTADEAIALLRQQHAQWLLDTAGQKGSGVP